MPLGRCTKEAKRARPRHKASGCKKRTSSAPTKTMPKITATIVTHNEEGRIARAIHSLKCADEVLVVDDGSTDRTREVAASLGARVVVHPWEGFVGQKNFADGAAS